MTTADDPFATRIDLNGEPLAQELKTGGKINAVHVLANTGGAHYTLIAGHRRVAAATLLGWSTIRAIVHNSLNNEEARRLAWKETVECKSLTKADRWRTVARLLVEGRNQATEAALLGVDKSAVSRDAGCTRLPEAVRLQVGKCGFAIGYATHLIPHIDNLDSTRTEKPLAAFRAAPRDRTEFRKLVKKTRQGKRTR